MVSTHPILLHNTMGHKLERFEPISPDQVNVYTCGPTVYSYQHIGNFRAFIFADTLRRMLEYNGYNVRHVRNITDVGHLTNDTLGTGVDKIEAAARRQNMTPREIAGHITEIYHRDADLLNILRPTVEPLATEYVPKMIALTQSLVDREYGYSVDGDVYYEVSKFPGYGALSNNSVDDLVAGARVEVGEGKRSPADFALWKAAGPERLMRWESPWGEGVPGWHLECSAMALDLLGETLDIHTGGEDHVFPHHEDEIAQSEGATGKTFARFWLHNAFLQIAGDQKMSKSIGNIFTVSDLQERGIHPLSFRYFTFLAHYRTPLNFTWEALAAAQTALYRVWEAVTDLAQGGTEDELCDEATARRDAFHEAINRDLDIPAALATLHSVLASKIPAGQKLALVADFDRVLGLDLVETARRLSRIEAGERELLDARAMARSEKNWARSDELRSELAQGGLEVKDTPQGQRWIRRDVLPLARADEPPSAGG